VGKAWFAVVGQAIVVRSVALDSDGQRTQLASRAGDLAAHLCIQEVRQGDRRENGDDRDDHEQFDQREGASHGRAPVQ